MTETGKEQEEVSSEETRSNEARSKEARSNEEGRKSSLKKTRRWWASLPSLWKVVVGVVPVLSTILTTLFLLMPSLKPPELPREGGATLSNLRVITNVTRGEFLQRPGIPQEAVAYGNQLSEEQLEQLGSALTFDVELKGPPEEEYYLRWSIYDAVTGKPLDGMTNQSAFPSDIVRPHSPVSHRGLMTWIPLYPDGNSPFLIDLEIYRLIEEMEVPLDSKEVSIGTQDTNELEDRFLYRKIPGQPNVVDPLVRGPSLL